MNIERIIKNFLDCFPPRFRSRLKAHVARNDGSDEASLRGPIGTKQSRGFTLVEMVIVIMIISIIFGVLASFISRPILAYNQIAHRAELVDAAEAALTRMGRAIRLAVPNSIRIKTSGNYTALEILDVVEAIRYRAENAPTDANTNHFLDFSQPITQFNVIGNFDTAQYSNGSYRLVIYNTGAYGASTDSPTAGENVYTASTAPGPSPPAGSAVITPAATTATLAAGTVATSGSTTEDHVTLSSAFQFAFPSPSQRLYVSDGPISYVCNIPAGGGGTLTQYSGYAIQSVQPVDPTAAPLSTANAALISKHISGCSFTYQPGTSRRAGIATLSLTLTYQGETITLLHQLSMSNTP